MTATTSLNPLEDADRRIFIKGLGLVGVGFVGTTLLGGCETLLDKIRNRPVRRRLRTGNADVDAALAIYRDAVSAMKALPASDPRSWTAQAAIHGTVSGGFNLCQHGTDHFFTWHRAYLYYFERICQELTGERSFGLPYWNWNQDPAIHPDFTVAGGALSHPRTNTTVGTNAAFSDTNMSTILSDSNFFTFSSQLEGSPHNTAHVVIGGDMASGGSASDPLFWVHHCMVDYCWAKWNLDLGNSNPNDPAWTGTSWNHFVDGSGNPVTIEAGTTPLMLLLSYQYESSAIGTFPAASAALAAQRSSEDLRSIERRLREGADIRLEIRRRVPLAGRNTMPLARPFVARTRESAAELDALITGGQQRERIFAKVDFSRAPQANDFFVRVFVAMPEASARTPTDDPHYAGSFAFFGTHDGEHRHGHAPKLEFLVDVTGTLQRLKRQERLRANEPITLTLQAVPVEGAFDRPDAMLELQRIELIVTPVVVAAR